MLNFLMSHHASDPAHLITHEGFIQYLIYLILKLKIRHLVYDLPAFMEVIYFYSFSLLHIFPFQVFTI